LAIIQLISDFQTGSYKIGLLHSQLQQSLKDVDIIDISHDIKLHNIVEATFVLKHLQFTGSQLVITLVKIGSNQRQIIYQHKNNWFILPDNGLISLMFDVKKNDRIFTFKNEHLTETIQHILDEKTDQFALTENYILKTWKKPMVHDNMIVCERIYTDKHGNCYFNMTRDLFESFFEEKRFSAKLQFVRDAHFYKIYNHYNDVEEGVALLMFSRMGFLKLAMNQGNASQLFRIKENTQMIIQKI
jgi:S-adenosylmethionine hydrolase